MKELSILVTGNVLVGKTLLALVIQDMLKRELGVTVKVEGSDDSAIALREKLDYIRTPEGRVDFAERFKDGSVNLRLIDGSSEPLAREVVMRTRVGVVGATATPVAVDGRPDLAVPVVGATVASPHPAT